MRLLQLVPQRLQAQRGRRVPRLQEEGDHLAEDAHAAPARRRAGQEAADDRREPRGVRRPAGPAGREPRERLGGVERHVPAAGAGGGQVQPGPPQPVLEARPVRLRGDHDRGVARAQGLADELADGVQEEPVRLVELDDVPGLAGRARRRPRRGRPSAGLRRRPAEHRRRVRHPVHGRLRGGRPTTERRAGRRWVAAGIRALPRVTYRPAAAGAPTVPAAPVRASRT